LFHEAPVGYHEIDTEGRIVRVNQTEWEMLGYTVDEMLGRPVWEFSSTPEESQEAVRAKLGGHESASRSFERIYRRKDGTAIPVLIEDRLLRDAVGRIIGIRSILQDITERKRAENALRKSEGNLARAQEIANLGSWELDLASNELWWSDQVYRIFGLTPQQFGATYEALLASVHPDDRATVDKAYTASIENHTPYESTHRVVRPDGEVRVVRERCDNVVDDSGTAARSLGTVLDITEQKRMEAKLRQREKELAHLARLSTMGEMATGLAHELNQPLYAITNYAKGITQHLRAATADPGDLREVMDKIAGQARRASNVITRLRKFAKKRETQRSTTDLNRLSEDLLNLLEYELRQSGTSLETRFAEQLPGVVVDSVQIEQVLVNLIRNALDAMRDAPPERRRLTLTTSAVDGQAVEISVADTGKGLSPEVQGKLFEPFLTTKTDGLGMGLAISRTIMEAHDGRIWAAPNSPHGTIFRFALPILEQKVTYGH